MEEEVALLATEQNNPGTIQIDQCSTVDVLAMINHEDQTVPAAVEQEIPSIGTAVDGIVSRMRKGGRLLYVGAGTSGRLGVLDASECTPTYGTPPELVMGIIAGGQKALISSIEGAEDSRAMGVADMVAHLVGEKDSVVGIAASGRTPYVLAALQEARARGAFTVGVCNIKGSLLSKVADIAIEVDTGPEVIMGSTRMKAGTAQKLVLNMLSTGTMIRLGKVYQNYMVDLNASNQKLHVRAVRIIHLVAGVEKDVAAKALEEVGGNVKTAILMLKMGVDAAQAEALLAQHDGVLRNALEAPR